MDGDKVGGSDDEHEVRRKVLKDVIDGLEVGQILFPEILSFFSSHWVTYFLLTVDRPQQEYDRQVLNMFINVQFLRVLLDFFGTGFNQTQP